ncbi:MAG TPA: PAS domain-containing protein, partial [Sphingobacteriaceae bacterium]
MDKTSEILDLLPVACYHLNTNYLITYVNRYASKLFGHFPEDCLGCDIRKLFPETKVTSCFRVMDSALNGRRPGSHDYVSAVTHRWIRLTATPSSHGAVVSFSDIHDLKKDGQNPEIHEAGFRSLFSMMDTGFCIIQKEPGQHLPLSDYLFLAANPAFERHTGLRTAAGKTIRQLLPAVEDRILD